jgi:hypothetical protein
MILKTELESLYARHLTVVSTIRELESWKRAMALAANDSRAPGLNLEISAKPCNLTSCRSA